MKIISCLLFLLTFSCFCYAQDFWNIQTSNTTNQLNSVHFANKNNGWIVGLNGFILHTNSGGANWQKQESNTIDNLNAVCAISNEVCYTIGDNGTILKTINSGSSWIKLSVQTDFTLRSLYFLNETTGWIVGGGWQEGGATQWSGKILYTTDGGNTWSEQLSTHYGFLDIQFLNDQDGYVMGFDTADPVLYFTRNGGTDWDSKYFYMGVSPPYSMQFLDIDNGFLTYESGSPQYPGGIINTLDRGFHWEYKSSFPYAIKSLFFFDVNNGYVCGDYGSIYFTNNGGAEWKRQEINIHEDLKNIFFIDDSTGWAIGANGTILKTSQGIPTSIKSDSNIPHQYIIYQNYPNPFNPSTTINYSIPQSTHVRIVVFDILGREVSTLINEEQSIGNYSVEFNSNNLSSGIYYYQIKANGFTQTKKMILLR